jgi:D-allulose-6-phosphate 3-epimerase
VDGQINSRTFKDVIEAGANVLVVGTSGLFNVDKDLKKAVQIVKEEIRSIVAAL